VLGGWLSRSATVPERANTVAVGGGGAACASAQVVPGKPRSRGGEALDADSTSDYATRVLDGFSLN